MSIHRTLLKCVCVLMCMNKVFGQLLYEDDPCRTNGGKTGICRLEPDCPEVVRNHRVTGVRPTLCGFSGNTPILCCPEQSTTGPTTNFNTGSVNFNPRPRPGPGSSGVISPPNRPSVGRPPNPPISSNVANRNSRVSHEMCTRYSKSVTQQFQALPLLPDPEPLTITVPKCTHNSSPLIVGGEETQVGEFPHMAAIGFEDGGTYKFNCGGTLISEYFVVTAAHCTFSRDYGQPKIVRLGEHDLESSDDGVVPVDYTIFNITVHPEYKSPAKYHDIALLRLARRVEFSNTIRPACLWQRMDFDQENAVATGWGQLAYGMNGPRPSALQKVPLKIIDYATCGALPAFVSTTGSRSLRRGIIQEQLCAGDLEKGGKDTCQGDSGGPLQITNSENRCIFFLIGVTSYGMGCGGRNSPGVYTRVFSYLDWIEGQVWSN